MWFSETDFEKDFPISKPVYGDLRHQCRHPSRSFSVEYVWCCDSGVVSGVVVSSDCSQLIC